MKNKDWKITFQCAEYGVHDQVVFASSAELLELSRNQVFNDLLDSNITIVMALVAYGESRQ